MEFPREVSRFAVAGDWHANTTYATKAIHYAAKNGAQVILHVGDFGYRFTKGYLNALNNEAEQKGVIIMFADGNHEDFDWLLNQEVDEDGVRRLRERVWHLPRGFRWEWLGYVFLALGGAHSVDRQWRTPGAEWWPQERIQYKEAYAISEGLPVDVMITHDCPNHVEIPGLLPDGTFPAVDIKAAEQNRIVLGFVVDELAPKWLFHGHYHIRYNGMRNTGYAQTHIVGLHCDGNEFEKNMILVNTEEL